MIKTSKNSAGLPVVEWVQEVASGRTVWGRFTWLVFFVGFVIGYAQALSGPNVQELFWGERFLGAAVIGIFVGGQCAIGLWVLIMIGYRAGQTDLSSDEARILVKERCTATIENRNGVPYFRMKVVSRNRASHRAEVLALFLTSPLVPHRIRQWFSDKMCDLQEPMALRASSVGRWLMGFGVREWEAPLDCFESFQLGQVHDWYAAQANKSRSGDALAIVADCGTRGVRLVCEHAGCKAFATRLHAVLTEAFVGSRAMLGAMCAETAAARAGAWDRTQSVPETV